MKNLVQKIAKKSRNDFPLFNRNENHLIYLDHAATSQKPQKVIDSFQYREERGMRKYGVNTDRTDLSTMEWLQHLQEELMDACVYVEKLKSELSDG